MPSSLLDLVNTLLATSLDWPSLIAMAFTVVVLVSVIGDLNTYCSIRRHGAVGGIANLGALLSSDGHCCSVSEAGVTRDGGGAATVAACEPLLPLLEPPLPELETTVVVLAQEGVDGDLGAQHLLDLVGLGVLDTVDDDHILHLH